MWYRFLRYRPYLLLRTGPLGTWPLREAVQSRNGGGDVAWLTRHDPARRQPLYRNYSHPILRKRATNAGIKISGTRRTQDGDLERVQISNHSTRRGLVTEALEAGRRIEDVAEHAGFAPGSKTIYEYWDLTSRGWEGNAAADLL